MGTVDQTRAALRMFLQCRIEFSARVRAFAFLSLKKKSSAVWHKATNYVEKSPNTEKLFIFARKQSATADDEKKKKEKSCKRNTNQTDRDAVRFNSFCDVIRRSRNKDSWAFLK